MLAFAVIWGLLFVEAVASDISAARIPHADKEVAGLPCAWVVR